VRTIATEFRDRRHREERKHRLNREIMAPEVRLSGPDNEPLGIVPLQEALRMAGELDVDLVEIAATAAACLPPDGLRQVQVP
jgi:translation initiation factor IF-3